MAGVCTSSNAASFPGRLCTLYAALAAKVQVFIGSGCGVKIPYTQRAKQTIMHKRSFQEENANVGWHSFLSEHKTGSSRRDKLHLLITYIVH